MTDSPLCFGQENALEPGSYFYSISEKAAPRQQPAINKAVGIRKTSLFGLVGPGGGYQGWNTGVGGTVLSTSHAEGTLA